MPIICPRCGAQYDVTLFTFDRTIQCECGQWVDLRVGHTRSEIDEREVGKEMTMTISSEAFSAGERIPIRYTGDGEDVSPPLNWNDVPATAKELALICDDPDAPTPRPWVHWGLYKIPATVHGLAENIPAASSIESPISAYQGRNSWPSGRTIGYRGPAPPPGHGTHHYHFKLYALDTELELNPGIDKAELLRQLSGHIQAEAELIGTYER
jgi:hypothetical protein